MVRTTTADVEVRHARNNVSSGSSGNIDFSSIVSQYVATEWAHLKRAAAMSHFAGAGSHGFRRLMVNDVAGGNEAVALPGGEGSAPDAKRMKASATGRRRGRTAIQLFAADHDLSELKSKGKLTGAYHKQLAKDFDELTDVRKAHYEALATMSLIQAREQQAKENTERTQAAASPAEQLGGPIAAPAIGDAPANDTGGFVVLPMNIVMQAGAASEDEIVAVVERASTHIAEVAKLYASNDEDSITNQLVEEDSFGKFIDARPVKTIASEFQSSTRRVGRPSAGFEFPDVVEYPHHCRCFCENHDAYASSKALQVLSMLSVCAKRCGSPSKIPSAGMLLLADAFIGPAGTAAAPAQSCWWMVAASFQSGHHVPTQTFLKCVPVGAVSSLGNAGQRLVVERGQFAQMSEPHPQLSAQSAPPQFYDEETVACTLVTNLGIV